MTIPRCIRAESFSRGSLFASSPPTFIANKGYPTTHFDMDSVEAVGLVKMDILAQGGLGGPALDQNFRGISFNKPGMARRTSGLGNLPLGFVDRADSSRKVRFGNRSLGVCR